MNARNRLSSSQEEQALEARELLAIDVVFDRVNSEGNLPSEVLTDTELDYYAEVMQVVTDVFETNFNGDYTLHAGVLPEASNAGGGGWVIDESEGWLQIHPSYLEAEYDRLSVATMLHEAGHAIGGLTHWPDNERYIMSGSVTQGYYMTADEINQIDSVSDLSYVGGTATSRVDLNPIYYNHSSGWSYFP